MTDDSSIFEKMVEMGMGMAVAQQMPRMMNAAMANVGDGRNAQQTPPPIGAADMSYQLYVAIDGVGAGPFTEQETITLIQKGKLNAQTLVWQQGLSSWVPASNVPWVAKQILLQM